MARPTPKLGKRQKGSAWRHESHTLSDAARQQLVGLLGFAGPNETSEPILAEVSRLLGALGSADGRQALDNAPRGSDYVRGYRKLAESVRALQAELASLHPRLAEQLDACLMSTPAGTIEQARGTVDCLLHAVTDGQALWHKSSAGRPKSIAVQLLVLQLRTIFRKHYPGAAARAKKRAAFASLSESGKRERKFIEIALEDARIQVKNLDKLLRELKASDAPGKRDKEFIRQMRHAEKMARSD